MVFLCPGGGCSAPGRGSNLAPYKAVEEEVGHEGDNENHGYDISQNDALCRLPHIDETPGMNMETKKYLFIVQKEMGVRYRIVIQ